MIFGSPDRRQNYISHRFYSFHSNLVTSIQVDEKTREELLKYASELQSQTGMRVSFDEAIARLLEEVKGVREAREKFEALFGSLRGERGVWRELEALRRAERRDVEERAESAG